MGSSATLNRLACFCKHAEKISSSSSAPPTTAMGCHKKGRFQVFRSASLSRLNGERVVAAGNGIGMNHDAASFQPSQKRRRYSNSTGGLLPKFSHSRKLGLDLFKPRAYVVKQAFACFR